MNLQSSQIKLLHPVLNVFSCQILYCHEVTVITQKTTENRLLVVATPGIFLIHQRSFPKTISVKEIIPFSQLATIKIERQSITLSCPTMTLVFHHIDQLNIANRIVYTRCALFDPIFIPLNLHVAQSLCDEFQNQNFDYTTESRLADRFLSICLTLQQQLFTEKMEQSYNYLSKIKDKLLISNELTRLPYLAGITMALEQEKSLTDITINDIKTQKNFKLLCILIKSSISLKKVAFNNVVLDGASSLFGIFSDALINSKGNIDEWVFDHCNFKSDDFRSFLECFREYKINIKSLIFNECTFSEQNFTYFTDRFFFIDCFHSLESLWLSDINFANEVSVFLSQLFASDWVLKNHTLKNLVIPKCCVELDNLFSQMQNFETGITTADFSGNLFINSPPTGMATNLNPQINFIFSNCGFADNTFSSLMEALASHKGQTMRLDISHALSSPDSWKQFSQTAPSLLFRSLVTLVWDGNPIDRSFCDFISKQTRLNKLSISDCVSINDSPMLLPELTHLFEIKTLDSLTIRASKKKYSLGYPLIDTIMPLLKKRALIQLDITGQEVSEEGITIILDNMPMVMKTFKFERNGIVNSDVLINILNSVLKKRLSFASWPQQDVENTITRTDAITRSELRTRLDVLKKQFDSRFGDLDTDHSRKDPLEILHAYSSLFKEHDPDPSPSRISWRIDSKPVSADKLVLFRVPDDSLSELLKECNSLSGKDPMASMVQLFESETTLEKLATGLHSSIIPDTLTNQTSN